MFTLFLLGCLHKSPPTPARTLEISLVDDATTEAIQGAPTLAEAQALAPGARVVPACREIGPWMALEPPALTEADVVRAKAETNEWGEPQVRVDFSADGAKRLAEATEVSGRRIAIRVDGDCLIAPTIRGHIEGGSVSIIGGGGVESMDDMEALARALNAAR